MIILDGLLTGLIVASHYFQTADRLTLNAPMATKAVCLPRLLKCLLQTVWTLIRLRLCLLL